jgi:Tol biopolymer transport system component
MISSGEGIAVQQVAATTAPENNPIFSPDGKIIYYVKGEGDRYYIWGYNFETNLHTQYAEGFTPCISKDGKTMYVTRRKEIWKIDLEKGTETLILSDPKKSFSTPQLHPDEKYLVCVGLTEKTKNKRKNLDLYKVNVDGTGLTQLTFHPGDDLSPVWSRDGKSIFFLSQRGNKDGKWNLWRLDLE